MKAIIAVDYQELHPETYRGVIVRTDHARKVRFNTSNAEADYALARAWCEEWGISDIYRSSSVDNFILDRGNMESTNAPGKSGSDRPVQEGVRDDNTDC